MGVDLAAAALRKRGVGGWRVVLTGDKAERGWVVAGSIWSRVLGKWVFQHVRGRIVDADETIMVRGDGWIWISRNNE